MIVVDIVYQCIALLLIVCTTIDDDTLLGIIAHHIGILLKEIEAERLDCNHSGR
jgi:hypothetical protein